MRSDQNLFWCNSRLIRKIWLLGTSPDIAGTGSHLNLSGLRLGSLLTLGNTVFSGEHFQEIDPSEKQSRSKTRIHFSKPAGRKEDKLKQTNTLDIPTFSALHRFLHHCNQNDWAYEMGKTGKISPANGQFDRREKLERWLIILEELLLLFIDLFYVFIHSLSWFDFGLLFDIKFL